MIVLGLPLPDTVAVMLEGGPDEKGQAEKSCLHVLTLDETYHTKYLNMMNQTDPNQNCGTRSSTVIPVRFFSFSFQCRKLRFN